MFKPPMTSSVIIIPRCVSSRMPSTSEEKIANFPANPASGGIPIRLNKIAPKQITRPGDERISPA